MSCPRELAEMKELVGRDDSVLHLSDEGGVWADGVDVNRMLLHAGMPGLESLGGKTNLDAMGDRCPKDDVDLIVIEGADHNEYSVCEVCGGIWLDLGLEEDADAAAVEAGMLDFFKAFRRPSATRSARP